MDDFYAIYIYKFKVTNDEGDWTQGEQVTKTDMSKAQDMFYHLFGTKNTLFRVQEEKNDGAKKYVCKVYGNDHRIVALRLQNDKEEHYYQEEPVPNDPMGKVKKKSIASTPCTYVIIDCRPGCNIIAVKVEYDAWRNTDTVRDLMESSINLYLESNSLGFRVQLLTKMQSREFFGYSKKRIRKDGRTVKKMTISFKTGKLNPKIEAIINNSDYLKRLFGLINKYGGESGTMTMNQPIGPKLIDRRRHDIENIVALISSDPKGYSLDMTFDDNVTLHCGKDTRAELPMEPEGSLELFHNGTKAKKTKQLMINFDGTQKSDELDENSYLLEGWLDNVAEETKKMKDAETIKPKRSRKNKREAS